MRDIVMLLVLVGVSACVKPPIQARQDPFVPAQVQLASEDLRRHTAFMAPELSRDAAGLLYVSLPIRAATDLQLYIDYRVTFLDSNGQPIQRTGWLTRTLAPNIFDRITVNSVSPRAADFQIDIRYAQ